MFRKYSAQLASSTRPLPKYRVTVEVAPENEGAMHKPHSRRGETHKAPCYLKSTCAFEILTGPAVALSCMRMVGWSPQSSINQALVITTDRAR